LDIYARFSLCSFDTIVFNSVLISVLQVHVFLTNRVVIYFIIDFASPENGRQLLQNITEDAWRNQGAMMINLPPPVIWRVSLMYEMSYWVSCIGFVYRIRLSPDSIWNISHYLHINHCKGGTCS